jgi:cell wall-associated NlpC family hydrolase
MALPPRRTPARGPHADVRPSPQRTGRPLIPGGRRGLQALGAITASPFALVLGIALASSGGSASASATTVAAGSMDCSLVPAAEGTDPGNGSQLDGEQVGNARIIYNVARDLALPERAAVIAIATAMQESSLRNLTTATNLDSLGLFQQRPSQGWGSPAELTDPVYASKAFYQRLVKVPGWESLPLTQAAQAVQLSGLPDAYAQWESISTRLAATVAGTAGGCSTDGGDGETGPVTDPVPLPPGYTVPPGTPPAAANAVAWALQWLGTPYQWGGTCTDPRGSDPMGRCDCSSLMQQAYKPSGITLTRVTYTQVREGTPIYDLNALQAGDLLFTRPGPQGPEHVGMYMGNGLIVHAPRTGDVVKVVSFESWRATIISARRVV